MNHYDYYCYSDEVNGSIIEHSGAPLFKTNKKYDKEKTFNQNLQAILNLNGDTLTRKQEDKVAFVKLLVEMDKGNKLSRYIWNGINTFNEI